MFMADLMAVLLLGALQQGNAVLRIGGVRECDTNIAETSTAMQRGH